MLRERTEEASDLISLESGLSKQDSRYEIGRVADVLKFSAMEALRDDGQSFSCDLTPHGKARRVFTQREPLAGVIVAITPFNHPMNQVAHKIAPAIATNNRVDPEAVGEGAFVGVLPRRRAVRSRFARADAASADRRPARNCRRTRHAPARRTRHVHRRRRDRQGDCGEGGLSASGARAGRQRSADRARRRRSRTRRHARRAGLVQELRPALHGSQAHARAEERGGALYGTASWKRPARGRYGDPFDPATTRWAP